MHFYKTVPEVMMTTLSYKLANWRKKMLKQQVKTVASLRECVVEFMKNARKKGGQNKSPCCVLWEDETQAVSHEKTRQENTLHHAKTSLEGIQKQNHMAKPGGQKIQKI